MKSNYLVDVATNLFLSSSIQEITIRDIAVEAGIGEATVYRYFGKKEQLVVASVMKLQSIVNAEYFRLEEGNNAFEKMSLFYGVFLRIFKEKPGFFRFLRDFDAFMGGQDSKMLKQYGDQIGEYKTVFMSIYHQGVEEGSIREIEDIDTFYYASTHALIELCKKLSLDKAVLPQDELNSKEDEVSCLIQIILTSLSSCGLSASKNK